MLKTTQPHRGLIESALPWCLMLWMFGMLSFIAALHKEWQLSTVENGLDRQRSVQRNGSWRHLASV